jgi:hypothetical protein
MPSRPHTNTQSPPAADDHRRPALLDRPDSPVAAGAQTIVQLLGQLGRQGYATDELVTVQRAYALAAAACACQYRSSGRALIDHVVTTTSVVAALGGRAALVGASLLHAAYIHGDFGTWRKRVVASKRAWVVETAGPEAEEIVYRYSALDWSGRGIPAIADSLAGRDALGRDAVLIRLADQLDIYGTRDVLYCANLEQRRTFARTLGPVVVGMAHELGYPSLAEALGLAYGEMMAAVVAPTLTSPPWPDDVIVPPSYRIRPGIALYQRNRAAIWRLTGR